jgi:hypothetical protein
MDHLEKPLRAQMQVIHRRRRILVTRHDHRTPVSARVGSGPPIRSASCAIPAGAAKRALPCRHRRGYAISKTL